MAAEDEGRTEEPSEYRIEKARKEGRVAKSQELSSALVLFLCLLLLIFFARIIFIELTEVLRFYFTRITESQIQNRGFVMKFYNVMLKCILPISLVGAVAGFLANVIQNKGFIFSTKPIEPKFSKIVPRFGEYLKKTVFSVKGLFNIFKSIGKVAIIVAIAYIYIKKDMFELIEIIQNENIILGLGKVARMAAQVLLTVAILFLVISIPDYFIQRKDFMNEMKMTKQEVKEEWKEMEGDPEVKSKLKQMQQQLLSKNVRKAVSESDVVIANPTHFAVALKYDAEKASAPMVNAKGEDNEAQIIKKIASDNDVPIVEDRIVARALYTNVEIGDIIPNEYLNVLAVIYSHLEKFKDYKG